MKKPSLIFIGDTHGFIDDFKKQKEIILKTKPEYVLCETIQNKKFLNKKDYETSYKLPKAKKLINLCRNKKIKLIGIDYKNFGLNKQILNSLNRGKTPTPAQKKIIQNALKKRTRQHIRQIKKYLMTTAKPIIVIIGAYHLRPKSPLLSAQKNVKIIQSCDKNKNPIYEPKQGKIHYLTRRL